jgi:hypothetical protein
MSEHDGSDCVRCDLAPAVQDGLCAHCTWAIRAEVEQGIWQLRLYLENDPHVAFEAYCRTHGKAA